MFEPLYCPNPACAHHDNPDGRRFWRHKGYFRPKCRAHPVPRFRCYGCGRGFSRQTFRADYRDHRPDRNAEVLSRLASGIGLRQIAREVGMSKRGLELKVRKLCRHLTRLHHNLTGDFPDGSAFAMDELVTFEGCRSTRPLTVPVLIEQGSNFVVDLRAASIPPSGKMTPARRARIEREQERCGRRRDRSQRVCAWVLATAARRAAGLTTVHVRTDRKSTYPKLLREAFGAERLRHLQVHGRQKRDTSNPLHRINVTLGRARDLVSRLRRRSWLVSKQRRHLSRHLMAHACYKNWNRPRFNDDRETPAMLLGFAHRPLSLPELLSWRQDHGARSVHPLRLCSVADYRKWNAVRPTYDAEAPARTWEASPMS